MGRFCFDHLETRKKGKKVFPKPGIRYLGFNFRDFRSLHSHPCCSSAKREAGWAGWRGWGLEGETGDFVLSTTAFFPPLRHELPRCRNLKREKNHTHDNFCHPGGEGGALPPTSVFYCTVHTFPPSFRRERETVWCDFDLI